MKKEKDISDYLTEKKQLENKLVALQLSKNRSTYDEVVIEEIIRKLTIINSKIANF